MSDKTVRTDIRTDPEMKAAYATFCEKVMKVSVSQRTRYLWRQDMIAWRQEDTQRDTA